MKTTTTLKVAMLAVVAMTGIAMHAAPARADECITVTETVMEWQMVVPGYWEYGPYGAYWVPPVYDYVPVEVERTVCD